MGTHPGFSASARHRVVRVFVSSSFPDMQEEREILARSVFLELRRRCRERQVEFVAVDLRGGMTEERTDRWETLAVHLAEVDGCRPYFIGLLGEKYGHIPARLDPELVIDHLWLLEHVNKSLTELEILHGVLREDSSVAHAFFYFRDPEYAVSVAEDRLRDFITEDPGSIQKLESLKDRIQANPNLLCSNYINPAALANLVLEDLWRAIDNDFPADPPMDQLQRDAIEQEAFAESRRLFHVVDEAAFNKLDEHVAGDAPPLVVTGEAGMGKSSLLAVWAASYRQRHPEDLVIKHFVGATSHSWYSIAITRRILTEINYSRHKNQEIPEAPIPLLDSLPHQIASACVKGRIVLILDAIDKVENAPGSPALNWLPEIWPKNVRLIVSTRPGPVLESLEQRGWSTVWMNDLDEGGKKRLVQNYMVHHERNFTDRQLERISTSKHTGNPLYLRTLLEGLRITWGRTALDEHIDTLLTAETPPALFDKILTYIEATHERHCPGMTTRALSFLWASRKGLYESELLELLGEPEAPFPHAHWSPLYLDLQGFLFDRWGILDFLHEDFLRIIEQRYVSDEKKRMEVHLLSAKYFHSRETDDRKVDELPWQLGKAQAWKLLHDCVTNLGMFRRLSTGARRWELSYYWELLHDEFGMAASYRDCIPRYIDSESSLDEAPFIIDQIGSLLEIDGNLDAAESFYRKALELRESSVGLEHTDTVANLCKLSELLKTKGEYTEAESTLDRALEIQERVLGVGRIETALTMSRLAELFTKRGDYAGAEALLRNSLDVKRKALGFTHLDVAAALDDLASLFKKKGDHSGAVPILREALQVRNAGLYREHPDTATNADELAKTLAYIGDCDGAVAAFRTAVDIYDRVFGVGWPQAVNSIKRLVVLLENKGEYEEAEPFLRRLFTVEDRALRRIP